MTKIMGNWETKLIRHKGEQRIAIYFDNDRKKMILSKVLPGRSGVEVCMPGIFPIRIKIESILR